MNRHDEETDRSAPFDDALRELAARPPRLAPRAAAAAVAARIAAREQPRRRRQLRLAWGLAAACLLALVVATTGTVSPRRAAPPSTDQMVASIAAPATTLGEGQVLIWLDERTPLYMNFAPPAPAAGGTDSGGGS